MRNLFCRMALTAGLVACCAIPALGQGPGTLSWTFEGASGFTAAPAPSEHTDPTRAMPNDMVVDDAGRIFTTANAPSSSVTGSGAISIYESDGAGGWLITDIDLAAAGYNGVVTKLIEVGGQVYGLQNYYAPEWWSSDTWGIGYDYTDRIIRISPTGSVNLIFDNGPNTEDRIVDIAGGPEGDTNIYMTMNGDLMKYFFFKRVNVSGPGPYGPEDTPNSPSNQGWGQRHTYYDLAYAGKMDDGTDMWIAADYHRGYYGRGPAGMGWDSGYVRQGAATPEGADAYLDPGFGWKWMTALEYSNSSKQVWMGSHSSLHYEWAWDYDGGENSIDSDGTATGGVDASQPGSADEAVIVGTKIAGNHNQWFQDVGFGSANGHWPGPVPNPMSMQIRFKINSYSTAPDPTYSAYLLELGPHGDSASTGRPPLVTLYFDGETGHLKFREITYDAGTDTKAATDLADLGAISTGTWYEVHIVLDHETLTAKCWLNGTEVYNGTVNPLDTWQDGHVGFGAAIDVDNNGIAGSNELYVAGDETAEVVFDYAVFGLGSEILPTDPDTAWPTQPVADGGRIASIVDGRVLPELWMNTNIMARFSGDISADGFFTHENTVNQYVGPVDTGSMWHANVNNPQSTNQPNGEYWLSTIKVNPKDGAGWMSWAADHTYDAAGEWAAVGNVYRMARTSAVPSDEDLTSNNLGAPQASHGDATKVDNRSHVVDIAFEGDAAYALVLDVETGEYNLFSAANPAEVGACCLPGGCQKLAELECLSNDGIFQGNGTTCVNSDCEFQVCHDPFADADGDGDVDQDDFARFQMCFTGAATGETLGTYPPQNCACFDTDGDGDVDGTDFTAFQDCASGPGIPADTTCDD